MLDFIRRWRNNRNRQIFSYWDGRRSRKADPLVIWRAIQDDPEFNIDQHPVRIDAGTKDAEREHMTPLIQQLAREAQAITAAAMRRAFDVKDYANGGLTESECLQLFFDFCIYLDSLKKNTVAPATLPQLTEPVFSELADQSIMKPLSDCGCS